MGIPVSWKEESSDAVVVEVGENLGQLGKTFLKTTAGILPPPNALWEFNLEITSETCDEFMHISLKRTYVLGGKPDVVTPTEPSVDPADVYKEKGIEECNGRHFVNKIIQISILVRNERQFKKR